MECALRPVPLQEVCEGGRRGKPMENSEVANEEMALDVYIYMYAYIYLYIYMYTWEEFGV